MHFFPLFQDPELSRLGTSLGNRIVNEDSDVSSAPELNENLTMNESNCYSADKTLEREAIDALEKSVDNQEQRSDKYSAGEDVDSRSDRSDPDRMSEIGSDDLNRYEEVMKEQLKEQEEVTLQPDILS